MIDSDAQASIQSIARMLAHYDRPQLLFQLAEIVGERTYLRHGVTVEEGDVVLDVGANVGVAAAFFAEQCKAGAVHSFEPVERLFELLRSNLRAWPHCVPHPYALSDHGGSATITFYPDAAAMSGLYADPAEDEASVRTYLVNSGVAVEQADHELLGRYRPTAVRCELKTMETVVREERLDRIDLLKIDVEKSELDVLNGIGDRDWPRIKQIVAEVHDLAGRLGVVTDMLTRHGFSVAVDQERVWRDTGIYMLYAVRS